GHEVRTASPQATLAVEAGRRASGCRSDASPLSYSAKVRDSRSRVIAMIDHRTNRRTALAWLGAAVAIPVLAACGSPAPGKAFRVSYTDAEWKRRLGAARFGVLREENTERPFSSPLNNEHRAGTFLCAGCDNELYSSTTKFDSGTGWPSFYRPLQGAIGLST